MDIFTFGITMLVSGMGGTILVLAIFSLIMFLLKTIFPVKKIMSGNGEQELQEKKNG